MKNTFCQYSLLILITTTICLTACRDDNSFKKAPLDGSWKVTQVSCDGVDQSSWSGHTITFNQVSVDSGTYQFPETPYDSIWNAFGTWKTGQNEGQLLFDRFAPLRLPVTYYAEDNKLTVNMLLPYYPNYPATDPTITIVHGNWSFEFERE